MEIPQHDPGAGFGALIGLVISALVGLVYKLSVNAKRNMTATDRDLLNEIHDDMKEIAKVQGDIRERLAVVETRQDEDSKGV